MGVDKGYNSVEEEEVVGDDEKVVGIDDEIVKVRRKSRGLR